MCLFSLTIQGSTCISDSLGQVKLEVGQVDLSKVFLYILYKENMSMYKFWKSGE